MNTMLKCGHAELMPKEEVALRSNRGWYIPHNAVRHPKKGSLQVVFDCSASYQGTSLNNELLKGPNLTNSLIGILQRFCHGNVAISADAVNTVLNNFFVDDLLKSVDTGTNSIQLYKELMALCAAGGFNLTKWSSNS